MEGSILKGHLFGSHGHLFESEEVSPVVISTMGRIIAGLGDAIGDDSIVSPCEGLFLQWPRGPLYCEVYEENGKCEVLMSKFGKKSGPIASLTTESVEEAIAFLLLHLKA